MLAAQLILFAFVGTVMFALPLWLIVALRKQYRITERTLARAVQVAATITKIDRAVDSTRWQPTFTFRLPSGASETARSRVRYDHEEDDLAVVGSSMQVLYDPDDPSWVYPERSRGSLRRMHRKALRMPLGLIAVGVFVSFGLLTGNHA